MTLKRQFWLVVVTVALAAASCSGHRNIRMFVQETSTPDASVTAGDGAARTLTTIQNPVSMAEGRSLRPRRLLFFIPVGAITTTARAATSDNVSPGVVAGIIVAVVLMLLLSAAGIWQRVRAKEQEEASKNDQGPEPLKA